jgi:hypothetical protein
MYAFYQACSKAGPQACAIYEKSPQAIKARVDQLLERLKVQPIATSIGSGPLDYGLVDFGLLQGTLFTFLYGPYADASTIASALAALETGNAGPFWHLLEATGSVAECSAGNDKERVQLDVETYTSIICTDGEPVRDSVEELQAWYEGNARKSSFAGTLANRVRCACVHFLMNEMTIFLHEHPGVGRSSPSNASQVAWVETLASRCYSSATNSIRSPRYQMQSR